MKLFLKNVWIRLIFFLVTGYFLFIPVSNEVLLSFYNYFKKDFVVALKLKELTPEEFARLKVPQWQQDYYSKFNIPPVIVSLDYIYIPPNGSLFGQKFCLDEIILQSIYGSRVVESKLLLSSKPLCVGKEISYGTNYFIDHEGDDVTFLYNSSSNQFWYPFDKRSISFNLNITGSFIGQTGQEKDTLPFRTQVSTAPPVWRAAVKSSSLDNSQKVTLFRLYIYQIIYILIPLSVILIIFYLPRVVKEMGSFWEVTVALAFGLSSLSGLFIPNYINYPTLASSTILSLYIATSIFMILAIVNNIIDSRGISQALPLKVAARGKISSSNKSPSSKKISPSKKSPSSKKISSSNKSPSSKKISPSKKSPSSKKISSSKKKP